MPDSADATLAAPGAANKLGVEQDLLLMESEANALVYRQGLGVHKAGRLVLAAGVGISACIANPPVNDAPMTTRAQESAALPAAPDPGGGMVPQWRDGDEWRVRYEVLVPDPRKSNDPRPRHEVHEWLYQLERPTTGADFHIRAQERDEDTVIEWHFRFGADGTLRGMQEPGDLQTPLPQHGPFLPLGGGLAWNLTPAWPVFPLVAGETSFQGGALTQSVVTDGNLWTVTVVHRGEQFGVDLVQTMVQQWETGRAWWSSATITTRSTWNGETTESTLIEGHVIDWGSSDRGAPR